MSKFEKKLKENLAVSIKISNFVPSFVTAYNYVPIFETVDDTKNPNLVAHEALSIREILVRSSRGQRLNVHERYRAEGIPDDMYPEDQLEKVNETIHDVPPDNINDIVDVFAYQEELERRKAALKEQPKKNSQEKPKGSPAPKPKANEALIPSEEGKSKDLTTEGGNKSE